MGIIDRDLPIDAIAVGPIASEYAEVGHHEGCNLNEFTFLVEISHPVGAQAEICFLDINDIEPTRVSFWKDVAVIGLHLPVVGRTAPAPERSRDRAKTGA